MNVFWRTLVAGIALAITGCGGPKWEEKKFPEWKFRVSLPGEVRVEQGTGGPGAPAGVVESMLVKGHDYEHGLGFTVEAHRSGNSGEPLISRLMGWIDYGERGPGIDVTSLGSQAVEYRYARDRQTDGYIVRFFAEGDLGYIVSAWGKTPEALGSPEVDRFFDSFQIEK